MLDENTWKIWFETFDNEGNLNGAGVVCQEYKRKGNAERRAATLSESVPRIRCTVSQTNPWQGK